MDNESPRVSVIIPARNEGKRIVRVIEEVKKVSPSIEIVVVSNGTTDGTTKLALDSGARVIEGYQSLGYDVGRAIGAYFAKGEVLLFIDADFVIPAEKLQVYINAVQAGWDIALNAYSGYCTKRKMHPTSLAKRLLNHIAGRPDLIGSSLTTVPHAMSRKAVKKIGWEELAVPPRAQAKAILEGLSITRVCPINTARVNKRRIGRTENVKELVLGDHAEAIAFFMREKGVRAGFKDLDRKRQLLQFPGHLHLRSIVREKTARIEGGEGRDQLQSKEKGQD
ncbi:glycosyltransferase family 2 protein [Brevibacillus borstelensis]|uniref:glycosyltransferase family 2 protein n=1 Tax=Brevibacillus borstelensis TaxID=45462 RepID=UPI0030BF2790